MQNTLNNYDHQTEDIIVSLKPENRDFFEKIQEYMIFSSFFRDEIAIRQLILQLALDLKAAEADGVSAVDYFGDEPKQMVDDLIKESNVATKLSLAKLLGIIVGILCYFRFWSDFASHGLVTLNLVGYLSDILFGVLGVCFIFYIFKRSVYCFTFLKNRVIKYGALLALILMFIVLIFLKIKLEAWVTGPRIILPTIISLALAALLCGLGIMFCRRDKVTRTFITPLIAFFLCGIIRFSANAFQLTNVFVVTILPLFVTFLGLITFYRQSYLLMKKDI